MTDARHGRDRDEDETIPFPGPVFEDIRLSTLETTGDAAEECPRTPDRQGIPPMLHPPPVIKQPRIHMSFKCGAGRRLDFGKPQSDQPPTSGSEPSWTHHGENARKRARSVEVCSPSQSNKKLERRSPAEGLAVKFFR